MPEIPGQRGGEPRASRRRSVPRATLTTATTLAAAAAGVWLGRGPVHALREQLDAGRTWGTLELDLLMSAAASAAVALAGLWLCAVTLATVVEALSGRSSTLVRSLSPAVVRRVVLLACGAAVSSGAVLAPATAVSSPLPSSAERSSRHESTSAPVTGLLLPDRPLGGLPVATAPAGTPSIAADMPAPDARRRPQAATPTDLYRVRAGDCLWSIAADLLPPGTGTAAIDATWRAIYRTNRAAIGADPDLLRPGAVLRLPSGLLSEPRPPEHHPRKDAS